MYKIKQKNKKIISFLTIIILFSIILFSCTNIENNFFSKLSEDAFINLQNQVNSYAVKTTIKITTKTNKIYTTIQELGSGVIFHQEEDKESGKIRNYALTNYHVIEEADLATGLSQQRLIFDYKSNKYDKYYIVNFEKKLDIAVIMFETLITEERLPIIKLAKTNPSKGSLVISIGYPLGQINSVTYGKVSDYRKVNVQQSNQKIKLTDFVAISHTAPGNHGSSGGPLIDIHLNLVGINFAGGEEDPKTGYSNDMWAIPIQQINHFLYTKVYDN